MTDIKVVPSVSSWGGRRGDAAEWVYLIIQLVTKNCSEKKNAVNSKNI
jgi:hypothetical protein